MSDLVDERHPSPRTLGSPKNQLQILRNTRWSSVVAVVVTMALLVSACGAKATPSASRPPPFGVAFATPWGTTWSYNPYTPRFPGPLYGLALLPLAVAEPPKLDSFVPELATSWQEKGSQLVVQLRKGAIWQNGKPVTATDVVDSLLLGGATGASASIFSDLTGLSVPNSHEVVFDVAKGVPVALVEQNVLATVPVPASVYGGLVTRGLEAESLRYYTKGGSAAGKRAAGVALQAVSKKLEAFNPPALVGDGPFRLAGMNGFSARLSKWPGFWAAGKVHVPAVKVTNASSGSAVVPMVLGGRVDFAAADALAPVVGRVLRVPHAHYVTPPFFAQQTFYFNAGHYPLSLVGVRQALAYAIDRKVVNAIGYSHVAKLPTSLARYPDGLYHTLATQYLSASQLHSLNPYSHDPAKAAKLLESEGFRKGPSGWLLPDGKPFTLTIMAPAALFPLLPEAKTIASELSSFGIRTTAIGGQLPGYWTYVHQGQFDIAWGWSMGTSLDPLAEFASVLGVQGYDYSSTGLYKGDPGIGFGPIATVPGLGRVNVPTTIQVEAATVPPGATMRRLTWDWVRLVNHDLPFLPYGNKNRSTYYSTARYVDWPSPGSKLWELVGLNLFDATAVMMERGYIRPRST